MARKTLIVGNWKMHKTIQETALFLEELLPMVSEETTCMVGICPPFTAISSAHERVKTSPIEIGAQNISHESEGAFTGEVSASMVKEAGATFAIIGHSERRAHYGETDAIIQKKLTQAFKEGLGAILCVGETEADRDAGKSESVLCKQLDGALKGFDDESLGYLVIAYEPVWAIGTGKSATPEIAQKAHRAIRKHIQQHFGPAVADELLILYGGSVKPGNIQELLNQSDIDGALIGGASLDAKDFGNMVNR